MRLLYFLAHTQAMGGAAKVLITQAYMMKKNGHEVKIVIRNDHRDGHSLSFDTLISNMSIDYDSVYYPIATCLEEIDILDSLTTYADIIPIVSDFKPDLLHSCQINIAVELVARELGIPHLMNVYQVNATMFEMEWLKLLPFYHSGDSNYYCDIWKNGLDITTKCIRVAYESKLRRISNKIGDLKKYHGVNIASFSKYKNQFQIIKFIEYSLNNGIEVYMDFVGNYNNPYGKMCIDYVYSKGLSSYISFIGEVIDVEKYLLKADFMVHLSTSESYPGVIVEAMANYVPIIIAPVGGVLELLSDEINCIIAGGCGYENAYESFIRLKKFYENGYINTIIKNAYITYESNHSYKIVGDELQKYYNFIITDYNDKKNVSQNTLVKNEIQKFFSDSQYSSYSEFFKKHVWYLYHIRKKLRDTNVKSCMIWGAGNAGRLALEWVDYLKLSLIGYIDNYKIGEYCGKPIYNFKTAMNLRPNVIFVSVQKFEIVQEIIQILENSGWRRNWDYFLLFNNPCY